MTRATPSNDGLVQRRQTNDFRVSVGRPPHRWPLQLGGSLVRRGRPARDRGSALPVREPHGPEHEVGDGDDEQHDARHERIADSLLRRAPTVGEELSLRGIEVLERHRCPVD